MGPSDLGRGVVATDYLVKATAAGGSLRAIGAVTTDSARAVQAVHGASPLAAAAMGRLMTGAAILAADFKGDEHIHLEVAGGGPAGRVIAEAYGDGVLRARIDHPDVELPLRDDGKLAVGQALGTAGDFTVRRSLHGGGTYTSRIPLVTGEIGEDVAHYLTQSEQVPSAVAVGVLVGKDMRVKAAGGVMVQALPGAAASVVGEIADRFPGLAGISHRLARGESLESLIEDVLPAPVNWAPIVGLQFGCRCSREHSYELLAALGPEDREEMSRQGGAEVICHYCRTAYQFGAEALGVDR
jgi:molecular chaperone Hsp33